MPVLACIKKLVDFSILPNIYLQICIVYIHTYIHIDIYIHIYTCIHTCIQIHIHMYICLHIHVFKPCSSKEFYVEFQGPVPPPHPFFCSWPDYDGYCPDGQHFGLMLFTFQACNGHQVSITSPKRCITGPKVCTHYEPKTICITRPKVCAHYKPKTCITRRRVCVCVHCVPITSPKDTSCPGSRAVR